MLDKRLPEYKRLQALLKEPLDEDCPLDFPRILRLGMMLEILHALMDSDNATVLELRDLLFKRFIFRFLEKALVAEEDRGGLKRAPLYYQHRTYWSMLSSLRNKGWINSVKIGSTSHLGLSPSGLDLMAELAFIRSEIASYLAKDLGKVC